MAVDNCNLLSAASLSMTNYCPKSQKKGEKFTTLNALYRYISRCPLQHPNRKRANFIFFFRNEINVLLITEKPLRHFSCPSD